MQNQKSRQFLLYNSSNFHVPFYQWGDAEGERVEIETVYASGGRVFERVLVKLDIDHLHHFQPLSLVHDSFRIYISIQVFPRYSFFYLVFPLFHLHLQYAVRSYLHCRSLSQPESRQ